MNIVRKALWLPSAGLVIVLTLTHCSSETGSSVVGTPCVLADESDPQFSGFRVADESIETGSPQCGGGVCLVNHFQGRVSCPLGQDALDVGGLRKSCSGPTDTSCPVGEACVEASTMLKTYVCHKKGNCQSASATPAENVNSTLNPKDCCVPGTDTPIVTSVCGQCSSTSNRNAEQAVYCSCRCGVADGEPDDPTFNFCTCPTGFACEQIRPNIGVGNAQITGKYCIKEGSKYNGNSFSCGELQPHSYFDYTCRGTAPL